MDKKAKYAIIFAIATSVIIIASRWENSDHQSSKQATEAFQKVSYKDGMGVLTQIKENCVENRAERKIREDLAGKPNRAADYFLYACDINGEKKPVEVFEGPSKTVINAKSEIVGEHFQGWKKGRMQINFNN